MPVTAEEKFYSAYAGTEPCLPSDETIDAFKPGGRYYICRASLDVEMVAQKRLVAELGCGGGQHLLHLKDTYGFDRAIGYDLGFARTHDFHGAHFKNTNLNGTWELEDGSVDVLVAMMLIEHLFDPYFCFREIHRVLHGGGRAFVNLPLVTNITNRLRLLSGHLPITSVPYARWEEEGHWDGFHLHYFSMSSIHDLARHAKLRVVSTQSVGRLKALKDLLPTLLCAEISFELRRL